MAVDMSSKRCLGQQQLRRYVWLAQTEDQLSEMVIFFQYVRVALRGERRRGRGGGGGGGGRRRGERHRLLLVCMCLSVCILFEGENHSIRHVQVYSHVAMQTVHNMLNKQHTSLTYIIIC